jgi:glycerol uptake facilitator-like aquaporin
MKSYIGEALGTCMLTLVLILATALGPWVGSVIAAFVLMFVVYGIGPVSGAHINPAITLGAFSIGKIKPFQALSYVIAQIAGAALAILALHLLKLSSPTDIPFVFSAKVMFAEMIGMAIFAFGIAGLVYKRVDSAASGFVAGLSLFLGLIASLLIVGNTGGSAFLNPAVAFGLGGMSLVSVFAPIVGSVIGMWVYSYLHEPVQEVARTAVANSTSF